MRNAVLILTVLVGSLCTLSTTAFAQGAGSLTFTVTPPLFQLSLQPGEVWTSGIQVVNSNPYDMVVYAEPVLFRPTGESGRPEFVDVTYEGAEQGVALDQSTLAGWITVPTAQITIPREQTYTLPVAITVPDDATPGGHYAAILIGNTPPKGRPGESTISVTSSIASLIFLRIAGDVIEDGRIREFSTEQSLYEDATARFHLRFENQGNVHLQPQGDITVYNMFGKQRGYIPVNHVNGYGTVLPESIREFAFTWTSDTGSWDIGRYRAEATIGYGQESKTFAQATAYFWVLPIVPLAQVIVGALCLLWFIGWALRAYVRRALALASLPHNGATGVVAPSEPEEGTAPVLEEPRVQPLSVRALVRPIGAGMVDLRNVGAHTGEGAPGRMTGETGENGAPAEQVHKPMTIGRFFATYKFFFLFVVLCIVGWVVVRAFYNDVTTAERVYEAVEERPDGSTIPL